LLTESSVLALAGGAAGLLLAVVTLDLLRGLAVQALPAYANLSVDWDAVLVTAFLALGTGLTFGLAPAFSVDRSNAQVTLRDETRGAVESRRSRRLRGALVAGQMALCVSLLAGAGLLVRSLLAMTSASLGFDSNNVLTATVQLPSRTYSTPEERALFIDEFSERVRALPGVTAVATATSIPTVVRQRMGITLEGTPPSDAQPFLLATLVSDDYFRTLRIPVLQGRTFDARDRTGAPPTIVISESAARRFWPAGNAVGSRLRVGPDPNAPLTEVIGIVGDVRNDRARPDAEPMAYGSTRRFQPPLITVVVRAQDDPLGLVKSLERELAAIDPGLPLQRPMTLDAVLTDGLAGRRLPVILLMGFGALALLLASVGVYAMFTSMAAAREREFGVRMALGSRPRTIAGLVLRQGAGWMAAGLGLGALGTIVVVRLVRELLYGVEPFDPIALGLSVVILVGCATIALLVPLRRATRVDPVIALRAQ
jgi:predicted permease